jgi:hypothetical protein
VCTSARYFESPAHGGSHLICKCVAFHLPGWLLLQGVNITNTDWSDVVLRKDQQMFLCKIANGTNPTTGVDTRESLVCPN